MAAAAVSIKTIVGIPGGIAAAVAALGGAIPAISGYITEKNSMLATINTEMDTLHQEAADLGDKWTTSPQNMSEAEDWKPR